MSRYLAEIKTATPVEVLWALPTIRSLFREVGEKIDMLVPRECMDLKTLLECQSYVGEVADSFLDVDQPQRQWDLRRNNVATHPMTEFAASANVQIYEPLPFLEIPNSVEHAVNGAGIALIGYGFSGGMSVRNRAVIEHCRGKFQRQGQSAFFAHVENSSQTADQTVNVLDVARTVAASHVIVTDRESLLYPLAHGLGKSVMYLDDGTTGPDLVYGREIGVVAGRFDLYVTALRSLLDREEVTA